MLGTKLACEHHVAIQYITLSGLCRNLTCYCQTKCLHFTAFTFRFRFFLCICVFVLVSRYLLLLELYVAQHKLLLFKVNCFTFAHSRLRCTYQLQEAASNVTYVSSLQFAARCAAFPSIQSSWNAFFLLFSACSILCWTHAIF